MKTLFIEARYNKPIELDKKIINSLPKRIALATTVQFIGQLEKIKKILKNKKIIIGKKTQKYEGQILGCDINTVKSIQNKVDGILYIGDGEFHPLGIAIKIKKPVFCYNPLNKNFKKISNEQIKIYKKQRKGALIKFLSAENIGILVSTKQGQYNLKNAIKLKNKLKNKKAYIFISDDIDLSQLENFTFIEAWVNTACPRIEKKGMVNIEEIK